MTRFNNKNKLFIKNYNLRLHPYSYYNLHPTQALRGLAWVKTERIAGRQQVGGVPKTAY